MHQTSMQIGGGLNAQVEVIISAISVQSLQMASLAAETRGHSSSILAQTWPQKQSQSAYFKTFFLGEHAPTHP